MLGAGRSSVLASPDAGTLGGYRGVDPDPRLGLSLERGGGAGRGPEDDHRGVQEPADRRRRPPRRPRAAPGRRARRRVAGRSRCTGPGGCAGRRGPRGAAPRWAPGGRATGLPARRRPRTGGRGLSESPCCSPAAVLGVPGISVCCFGFRLDTWRARALYMEEVRGGRTGKARGCCSCSVSDAATVSESRRRRRYGIRRTGGEFARNVVEWTPASWAGPKSLVGPQKRPKAGRRQLKTVTRDYMVQTHL
jgi:hypothetical protein